MSLWGMTHGDEWAEIGWGEGNVLAHDEAYEEMWALHLMPLGVMAIVTALVVTGKELAKVAICLLYTSPSPRDGLLSRMPSSA